MHSAEQPTPYRYVQHIIYIDIRDWYVEILVVCKSLCKHIYIGIYTQLLLTNIAQLYTRRSGHPDRSVRDNFACHSERSEAPAVVAAPVNICVNERQRERQRERVAERYRDRATQSDTDRYAIH